MKEIVLSTGSKNKVKEMKSILGDGDFKVIDKNEAGFSDLDVEETGETLAENAIIKAEAIWEKVHKTVIADDTGLFVDALDGIPGVRSARYAGEHATDEENREKLLNALKDEKNRSARFITCIAVIDEDGKVNTLEGTCEGKIAEKETGTNGFGYDSIFVPEGYDISFGEISDELKNKISHRALAMKKLKEFLSD